MPLTVHPNALIVQEFPPSAKKHEHFQTRCPPEVPRTQMQQEPWADLGAAPRRGASMLNRENSTQVNSIAFMVCIPLVLNSLPGS
jgi:hypothetical protein